MTGAAANKQSFISHLKVLIQTYKKIKVNEIKSKVNDLNQKENISEINKEIISIMEYLLEKYKGKEIKFGFSIIDFKEDNDDDKEEENSEDEEDEDNFDRLPNSSIIKILYIYYKEKIIIPQISKETKDLLNYFQKERLKIKLDDNINNNKNKKKETQIEKYLNSLCGKLKKSKIDMNKIQKLINKITDTLEFLRLSDQIFIPILGPSNAGKTTIINGLIGRNILPTDLKECTKRGILISYSDQEDDEISVYKSNFKEGKIIDKPYYYLEEGYKIGKGLKQVNDLLKGLNYEFTEKEQDCFYYIKTKIKLFDELGLNDSLKRKIYLIDFPGYGTDNKFIEKKICKNIISICRAFIFVLRNSIIKENKTKKFLDDIFALAEVGKFKMNSGIINFCSFILNNDNSQTTSDTDINLAKNDIQEIIGKGNINLCFFNADSYSTFCKNNIYFLNIEETFDEEYNNYLESKNLIFKFPERITEKKRNSFIDFFIKQLSGNLTNSFGAKIKKLQTYKINNDVKSRIEKIIKKYIELKYFNMNEFLNKGDIFYNIFSYGQDKIKDIKAFKGSNIDGLKYLLESQFKYVYNKIREDFKNNIDNILSTLNEWFQEEFSIKKSIADFKIKLAFTKKKLNELLDEKVNTIQKVFNDCIEDITICLNNKKANMKIILKTDKSSKILNDIDNELETKLIKINDEINKILDNITKEIESIFKEGQNEVDEFSEGKIQLKLISKFNYYLLIEIGNNNNNYLMEHIFYDISKIFYAKGLGDFFKSTFSDYHYVINIIDIILQRLSEKMKYILSLLEGYLRRYIDELSHTINRACDLVSIRFENGQNDSNYLKEISDYYQSIKSKIEQAKDDIIKNEYEK